MEHFKELEKKVDTTLEDMILVKGDKDKIEELYYEFCEWVYAETNAQIRKEYSANYPGCLCHITEFYMEDDDV